MLEMFDVLPRLSTEFSEVRKLTCLRVISY